uniref:Enyol-CoA hydratase n=2 Tax=Nephromyces sp. MMRI TaxID=2496275 RepID=A0A3Q8UC43_9APIC|nr:enyol-CoA hydratase [Nephromyces sp. MMRI]AZL94644.1 enyol-CoA hydratase [Nephromyces sp. MMRI]
MERTELIKHFSTFQRIKVFSLDKDVHENYLSTFIWQVSFNRPEKKNAIDKPFWKELKSTFEALGQSPDCRCILLTNEGNVFSAGIDLKFGMQYFSPGNDNESTEFARKSVFLKGYVNFLQECVNSIEKCSKPVIACIYGGCLGAGVDIITACDIRFCSQNSYFCVKEIDIGLAADLGTLQRLPRIVNNHSWVREVCYTARNILADEALLVGLISSIFKSRKELYDEATKLALTIASKSPIAIYGTKYALNYSRDHTVQEGLDFQALWNSTMLQSNDMMDAASNSQFKNLGLFSRL